MTTTPTRFRPMRLAALAALVACFVVVPRAAVTEVIEQVLVKVNGEILTKTEFETRQISALRQLGRLEPGATPTDSQLRAMLTEVTPGVLINAIEEMLLVQRAKELGLKLTDEQFKSAVENIKKDNKIESEETFEAALKQENMTLADLRVSLERQMMVGQVRRNEVLGRISVTDEETRRYYDGHVSEFTTPAAVTLREVLVAVPADGEDDARKKADDVRRRATAGEAFDKLVGEVSDSPSKANAGLVGPIHLQDLAAEIRAVVEPLKVGEVSPVVRTGAGFQIFKIESIEPRQTVPYEQARDRISERVFDQKQSEEFRKYLDRLRGQAIIQWRSPDLQKVYEQALKQAAAPVL